MAIVTYNSKFYKDPDVHVGRSRCCNVKIDVIKSVQKFEQYYVCSKCRRNCLHEITNTAGNKVIELTKENMLDAFATLKEYEDESA